jgi:hypothetical protein
LVGQWGVEESLINSYRDAATKIFDALVFEQMQDENAGIVNLPNDQVTLQPYSKPELYEWNYRLYGIRAINKANRRDLRSLLQQATNLLNSLRQAYHLK